MLDVRYQLRCIHLCIVYITSLFGKTFKPTSGLARSCIVFLTVAEIITNITEKINTNNNNGAQSLAQAFCGLSGRRGDASQSTAELSELLREKEIIASYIEDKGIESRSCFGISFCEGWICYVVNICI